MATVHLVKHRQRYKGWLCNYSPIRAHGHQWVASKVGNFLHSTTREGLQALIEAATKSQETLS